MDFAEITALVPLQGPKGYVSEGDPPPHRRVVLAGADDPASMGVIRAGRQAGIGFILVGDADRIRGTAADAGVDLDGSEIIPPDEIAEGEASICRTAVRICVEGRAGILMKGLVGTASFTRAILDKSGGLTAEGAHLSHVGFFSDPRGGKPFLLSDAAINIAPDLDAKKIILSNAVAVARSLGVDEPRIALLAPVEKPSPKIPSTTDAVGLKAWVAGGGLGKAVADGPFGLDVAASAEAAETKGLDSPVAGRVDIYLAPNLDAGNIFYKSLTVFSGAAAAGILAGARVPVVLTSRADSEEVKLASFGLALRVASGA